MPDRDELTDRERAILAFASTQWRYPGAKEDAIRDLFDISPTRFSQVLLKLIDRPEALVHDPVLVNRLRRLRDERQRARSRRIG